MQISLKSLLLELSAKPCILEKGDDVGNHRVRTNIPQDVSWLPPGRHIIPLQVHGHPLELRHEHVQALCGIVQLQFDEGMHHALGPVGLTAVFSVTSDGKVEYISPDFVTGATGGHISRASGKKPAGQQSADVTDGGSATMIASGAKTHDTVEPPSCGTQTRSAAAHTRGRRPVCADCAASTVPAELDALPQMC